MTTASLAQGLLPRIEVSSEKNRIFNQILLVGLVFIQLAKALLKMRLGTQGAYFPANWMQLIYIHMLGAIAICLFICL